MGNRTKFVAATATAGVVGLAALRKRRHARLERAAEGIVEKIMPSVAESLPPEPEAIADEAHAPGHHHLPRVPDEPSAPRLRSRPWTKRHHGLVHPGRG